MYGCVAAAESLRFSTAAHHTQIANISVFRLEMHSRQRATHDKDVFNTNELFNLQ